jgi:hypothetical protein
MRNTAQRFDSARYRRENVAIAGTGGSATRRIPASGPMPHCPWPGENLPTGWRPQRYAWGRFIPGAREMSERSSGWSRKFDEPIALADGRRLVTLNDAATYITALPFEAFSTARRTFAFVGSSPELSASSRASRTMPGFSRSASRMMRASWMSLREIPMSAAVAALRMGTVVSPPPLRPTTSPRSCSLPAVILAVIALGARISRRTNWPRRFSRSPRQSMLTQKEAANAIYARAVVLL